MTQQRPHLPFDTDRTGGRAHAYLPIRADVEATSKRPTRTPEADFVYETILTPWGSEQGGGSGPQQPIIEYYADWLFNSNNPSLLDRVGGIQLTGDTTGLVFVDNYGRDCLYNNSGLPVLLTATVPIDGPWVFRMKAMGRVAENLNYEYVVSDGGGELSGFGIWGSKTGIVGGRERLRVCGAPYQNSPVSGDPNWADFTIDSYEGMFSVWGYLGADEWPVTPSWDGTLLLQIPRWTSIRSVSVWKKLEP